MATAAAAGRFARVARIGGGKPFGAGSRIGGGKPFGAGSGAAVGEVTIPPDRGREQLRPVGLERTRANGRARPG